MRRLEVCEFPTNHAITWQFCNGYHSLEFSSDYLGQMHNPSCSFTLIFRKKKSTRKLRDIILMVKECWNFSFLWGVEQVRRTENVVFSNFLYKRYRKQLKMAYFTVFGQIYKFQLLETIQNDYDALNRHYLNTF